MYNKVYINECVTTTSVSLWILINNCAIFNHTGLKCVCDTAWRHESDWQEMRDDEWINIDLTQFFTLIYSGEKPPHLNLLWHEVSGLIRTRQNICNKPMKRLQKFIFMEKTTSKSYHNIWLDTVIYINLLI